MALRGLGLAMALFAAVAPAGAAGPDLALYAQRYAAVCAACHGADGRSTTPLTPSLAGQPSFYAITQLFLFRDGRRDNPVMAAIAKPMTDDDLRGFSELIGRLPPPPATPPTDAARAARGAALAARLHCASCHGKAYDGGKQVPRLAGQRVEYLLYALRGFRAASRVGYTPAMTEALAGVDAEALEDLAHYVAGAGP